MIKWRMLPGLGLTAGTLSTVAIVRSKFAAALRIHRARVSSGSQVVSSRFGQTEFATVGHVSWHSKADRVVDVVLDRILLAGAHRLSVDLRLLGFWRQIPDTSFT